MEEEFNFQGTEDKKKFALFVNVNKRRRKSPSVSVPENGSAQENDFMFENVEGGYNGIIEDDDDDDRRSIIGDLKDSFRRTKRKKKKRKKDEDEYYYTDDTYDSIEGYADRGIDRRGRSETSAAPVEMVYPDRSSEMIIEEKTGVHSENKSEKKGGKKSTKKSEETFESPLEKKTQKKPSVTEKNDSKERKAEKKAAREEKSENNRQGKNHKLEIKKTDVAEELEYIETMPIISDQEQYITDREKTASNKSFLFPVKVSKKQKKHKKKDEYIPYSEAPTGNWSEFASAMVSEPVIKDEKYSNEITQDFAYEDERDRTSFKEKEEDSSKKNINGAQAVTEKTEYRKIDISQEEARGIIPYKALRKFCYEFARIHGSGVSVVGTLRIVKEQTDDEDLKDVLNNMYEGIKDGEELYEAMNRNGCFPVAFTIAVSVAEKNDMLSVLFERFGKIYEAEEKRIEASKTRFFHAGFTVALTMVIMLVMVLVIYPSFFDIFSALNISSDPFAEGLLRAAQILRTVWWMVLIVIIMVFIMIVLYKTVGINEFKQRPIGEKKVRSSAYRRMEIYTKFARYMNALLEVGVVEKDALFVTAHSFYEYPFINDKLLDAANAAAGGSTLSNALCVFDFFPLMVLQMISVGEEMGNTSGMLKYIADYYEAEAVSEAEKQQRKMEPATIIFMAVVMLLFLAGMLFPLLSLFNLVKGI